MITQAAVLEEIAVLVRREYPILVISADAGYVTATQADVYSRARPTHNIPFPGRDDLHLYGDYSNTGLDTSSTCFEGFVINAAHKMEYVLL